MRPLFALTRWLVHRHFRGPIIPVCMVLFVLLALALPLLGETNSVLRRRSFIALHLGAGAIVLMLLAVVLPHASLGWRRGRGPGGGAGPMRRQASAFLAHGLLLSCAACALGLATYGFARLSLGDPDARGTPVIIRDVWGEGPSVVAPVTGAGPPLRLSLPFAGLPREQPIVRLRLAPRVVVDRRSRGDRQFGSMEAALELLWRPDAEPRWRRKTVRFRRGRAEIVELRLEDSRKMLELQDAGRISGSLEISLQRRGGGQVAVFEPGSIVLLGTRGRVLSTILRGFLLLALGAMPLLAVCQWFSGFVSYSIAVGATITVALAGALLDPWFPGAQLLDPGARVADGLALAWTDLWPTAVKAGAFGAFVILLPFSDRRVDEDGA
ncbi:MAG: hypothetical protein CMJ83_17980 [Planctomycetes bacterium]|nr:hypothetical protein [Planctomycetota bacterium]